MPADDSGQEPDHDEDSDGDDTTTSTKTRWAYTNDIAAGLIIASFVFGIGALFYAIASGQTDQSIDANLFAYAYIVVVLLAATWLFGSDAFDALARLRGGGSE